MIVDSHAHLLDTGHWPAEWWQWVAEDWARKEPGRHASDIRDKVESGLVDPHGARMITAMDDAGVDMTVILPIDWGPNFTGTKPIADVVAHALSIRDAHPERIIPFGGVDPRRPGAPDLVSEWLESGIKGLKLYPSCGWHPTADEAADVYQLCNDARIPVLFHTGDPLPLLQREYSNPALLREVAKSYPDMPIWLGHAGAPRWWDEALQLAAEFPNVRLEMSVWIWDDSSESTKDCFARHVAEALTAIGASQILFGSDNVSGRRKRREGFLRIVLDAYQELPDRLARLNAPLTDSDMNSILGGNALRDLQIVDPTIRHGKDQSFEKLA